MASREDEPRYQESKAALQIGQYKQKQKIMKKETDHMDSLYLHEEPHITYIESPRG